jgi:K+-sensing histidine kinase KdpD
MVRRALSNLISNAMRYTPAAGSIAVSIARSEGDVLVAVENDGPESRRSIFLTCLIGSTEQTSPHQA